MSQRLRTRYVPPNVAMPTQARRPGPRRATAPRTAVRTTPSATVNSTPAQFADGYLSAAMPTPATTTRPIIPAIENCQRPMRRTLRPPAPPPDQDAVAPAIRQPPERP